MRTTTQRNVVVTSPDDVNISETTLYITLDDESGHQYYRLNDFQGPFPSGEVLYNNIFDENALQPPPVCSDISSAPVLPIQIICTMNKTPEFIRAQITKFRNERPWVKIVIMYDSGANVSGVQPQYAYLVQNKKDEGHNVYSFNSGVVKCNATGTLGCLPRVHVIDGMQYNIVSGSQLAHCGYYAVTGRNGITLRRHSDHSVALTGAFVGDVWLLDMEQLLNLDAEVVLPNGEHINYCNAKLINRAHRYHLMFGHFNYHALRHGIENGTIDIGHDKPTEQEWKEATEGGLCDVCAHSKSKHKKPKKTIDPSPATKRPFEKVTFDTVGPAQVTSRRNCNYFTLVLDMHTHFVYVLLQTARKQVAEKLQMWYNQNVRHRRFRKDESDKLIEVYVPKAYTNDEHTALKVQIVRHDGAPEYTGNKLKDLFESWGTGDRQVTVPRQSNQMGSAERKNLTIEILARSLLLQLATICGKTVNSLWCYAVEHACWLHNRLPKTALGGKSPFEMLHGYVPKMSRVPIFGCLGYAPLKIVYGQSKFPNVPYLRQAAKFASRVAKVYFLGFKLGTKGYLCWMPETNNIAIFSTLYTDESHLGHTAVSGGLYVRKRKLKLDKQRYKKYLAENPALADSLDLDDMPQLADDISDIDSDEEAELDALSDEDDNDGFNQSGRQPLELVSDDEDDELEPTGKPPWADWPENPILHPYWRHQAKVALDTKTEMPNYVTIAKWLSLYTSQRGIIPFDDKPDGYNYEKQQLDDLFTDEPEIDAISSFGLTIAAEDLDHHGIPWEILRNDSNHDAKTMIHYWNVEHAVLDQELSLRTENLYHISELRKISQEADDQFDLNPYDFKSDAARHLKILGKDSNKKLIDLIERVKLQEGPCFTDCTLSLGDENGNRYFVSLDDTEYIECSAVRDSWTTFQRVQAIMTMQSGEVPDETVPNNIKQALADKKWRHEAVFKELKQLSDRNTWIFVKKSDVEDLARRQGKRQILPTVWRLKLKDPIFSPEGEIIQPAKRKGRITVNGKKQFIESYDKASTYAPVADAATIRLMLVVAAFQGFYCRMADVCNAFALCKLDEEIYLHPPAGMRQWMRETDQKSFYHPVEPNSSTHFDRKQRVNHRDSFLLRLKTSLYGLHQAANLFYKMMKKALENEGFTETREPCLFIRYEDPELGGDGSTSMATIYVDDIIHCIKDREVSNKFVADLNAHNPEFELKDLGSITVLLGQKVVYDRTKRTISFGQQLYAERLHHRFQLSNIGGKDTSRPFSLGKVPMNKAEGQMFSDPSAWALEHPEKAKADFPLSPKLKTLYRAIIGALLHVVRHTRGDLMTSVYFAATAMHAPTHLALLAVKKIALFLYDTREWTLNYNCDKIDKISLTGYSDASFCQWPDGRSRVGYVIYVGSPDSVGTSGAIIWNQRLERARLTATSQSETYGLFRLCDRTYHLRYILHAMGFPQFIGPEDNPEPNDAQHLSVVYCDNSPTIKQVLAAFTALRTRAYHSTYWKVVEYCSPYQALRIAQLEWVSTLQQWADHQTKILYKPEEYSIQAGMLLSLSESQKAYYKSRHRR